MKINWHYDIQNEIGAFLFAAGYIEKGYFGNKAYYVLPELPEESNLSVVYFPELSRKLSQEEWDYCDKTSFDIPVRDTGFPGLAWLETELKHKGLLADSEMNAIKQSWDSAWPRIQLVLQNIFTPEQLDIENMYIFPTKYGATAGYYHNAQKSEGYIYIRADLPYPIILRMLLMIIIRRSYLQIEKHLGDKAAMLSGKQAKVDVILAYLVRATALVEFFPAEKNHYAYEENIQFAKASQNYMKSLGFQREFYLERRDKGIYDISASRYLQDLTELETNVLALMLENVNELCTYEQLAALIWGEAYAEKFSLYAISKLIQRLRLKIRTNGISDYKIKTVRNKGYLLYK